MNIKNILNEPSTKDGLCFCSVCQEYGKFIGDTGFVCEVCGYSGTPGMIECACYDIPCRPIILGGELHGRGMGCYHGVPTCPICSDGEADAWAIIRRIREETKK